MQPAASLTATAKPAVKAPDQPLRPSLTVPGTNTTPGITVEIDRGIMLVTDAICNKCMKLMQKSRDTIDLYLTSAVGSISVVAGFTIAVVAADCVAANCVCIAAAVASGAFVNV